MSEAEAGEAIDLGRLRAVAEDPLVRPSLRVQARKVLRAYREQAEAAEGAAKAIQRLRAKIAAGRDLTWREAATARAMGLMGAEDED